MRGIKFNCIKMTFFNRALLSFFALAFFSCQNSDRKTEEINTKINQILKTDSIISVPNIKSKIFLNQPSIGGWGYDIIIDGVQYIHQTNIPATNGIKGFLSEEDAGKVANLVISKIKNKITPPTITFEEMDSLQIQK